LLFFNAAGMVTGRVKVSATAETGKSMASMQTPQPAQKVFVISFSPEEGMLG